MAKSMQFAFNDWKLQGLEGHTSAIRVIGANEYQRVLATGSKDRTVKLWSLDIHRAIESPDYADARLGCLMTYNRHRRGAIYDLHFATGGGSFGTGDIVASCDGQIHLWEPETGKTVHQFSTGKAPVVAMTPIHRSRYIAAGLVDGTRSASWTATHMRIFTVALIKSIRGTSEIVSLEITRTMHNHNSISFTPINDDSLAYISKFKSSAIRS
ncbi:hypothetical protein BGZ65_011681, partial [Modicella reniformis]